MQYEMASQPLKCRCCDTVVDPKKTDAVQRLAPDANASELISRLEALEACGSGCLGTGGTADDNSGSSTNINAQTADVRAAGCVAVQLFCCRRLLLSTSDRAAWDAQVIDRASGVADARIQNYFIFSEPDCIEHHTECCS